MWAFYPHALHLPGDSPRTFNCKQIQGEQVWRDVHVGKHTCCWVCFWILTAWMRNWGQGLRTQWGCGMASPCQCTVILSEKPFLFYLTCCSVLTTLFILRKWNIYKNIKLIIQNLYMLIFCHVCFNIFNMYIEELQINSGSLFSLSLGVFLSFPNHFYVSINMCIKINV